jgi:hypothetical protein
MEDLPSITRYVDAKSGLSALFTSDKTDVKRPRFEFKFFREVPWVIWVLFAIWSKWFWHQHKGEHL